MNERAVPDAVSDDPADVAALVYNKRRVRGQFIIAGFKVVYNTEYSKQPVYFELLNLSLPRAAFAGFKNAL